ncbi:hypothetical protein [Solwaraspora sp. WMMA2065]|uniref:hypothetical protein n=1 Tax=Solwaraspora sp. WMMA2065 TaxID=3015166 RepID=UPI00259BA765|nr:hypothetical protein [Solwaraspora sp. WMMA2065]WJK33083.1 hypothetical protein O7610_20485 [Solwaraspora sp. WMMA2065]
MEQAQAVGDRKLAGPPHQVLGQPHGLRFGQHRRIAITLGEPVEATFQGVERVGECHISTVTTSR